MSSRIDARVVALFVLIAACNRTPPESAGAAADSASPIEVADPELFAACDSLEQWTRTTGPDDVQRTDGQFTGAVRPLPRWGCRLVAVDSLNADSTRQPLELLRVALDGRGWTVEQDFVAESSEGAMTGMRLGTLVCVLQHYWDAHSDDERAARPADRYAYHLELECFRDAPRQPR
jgi:hypothetical protein